MPSRIYDGYKPNKYGHDQIQKVLLVVKHAQVLVYLAKRLFMPTSGVVKRMLRIKKLCKSDTME
jgi:hypothetical protein